MFYKITLFIASFSLLLSCDSNSTNDAELDVYPSDTLIINESYPDIDNETVLNVMESLQVCTLSDTLVPLPPCSNEFFRVFPIGPEKELENGFLLEMRAGLFGTPVKQLLIVEKSFNKYQIINQYLGFLVEERTTESGYNDLLMGYDDPEIGIVAIKHVWDGKKYQPSEVEEINGYFVKPELKDSINHLFIDNFNAGY
jgi:hypothetical protein